VGDAPFTPVGPTLDASLISDEGGRGEHASFTGAFVGMVAHDLTGQGWTADFLRFDYIPRA
jgi:xylan 1,4-beta-xylosidase